MTELKPLKPVAIPAKPPIDKLVAFKRVQLDLGDQYRLQVVFCNKNAPTSSDYQRWHNIYGAEMVYVVDLGHKKYHKLAGSAAMVEESCLSDGVSATWEMLRDLVTENNNGGMLKSYRHSIAKLIRDVYEVMEHPEFAQETVFNHGMDIVDAFFYRKNKRPWDSLFSDPAFEELRKLWEGFNVNDVEAELPFTLPLYFRQLFLSGRSVEEITQKISWWLGKSKLVDERRAAARAKKYDFRRFVIKGRPCGLVHVDNVFEAEAFTFQWVGSGKLALGILRQSSGHTHIQPSFRQKGIKLEALWEQLRTIEPGRWYYETRFPVPMVMNGSRQFTGEAPTSQSDDALVSLLSTHVEFAS